MLSRRDALKLGAAAGIALPILGLGPASANQVATPSADPESAIGPSLDAPIVVKWMYETGTEYTTTPVIVDNVAYDCVQGSFAYAIEAETGIEIWRHGLNAGFNRIVIEDELAIVATATNGLVALDTTSGTVRWQVDFSSVPVQSFAVDGTVYCGVENGELYALDLATGVEKWASFIGSTYSSNVVSISELGDSVIVTMGTPVLYALDKETGSIKWNVITQGYSLSAPIVNENVVYFASGEGLHAVDSQTGSQLWHVAIDASTGAGPVLDNGVLYWSVSEGPLYATDAISGNQIWEVSTETGGEGDMPYGAGDINVDEFTVTYKNTVGGKMFPRYFIHGVDRLTGEQLWQLEESYSYRLPASAGDGTLVVGEHAIKSIDQEDRLYALDTSTGSEIWTFSNSGGFTDKSVFANGNLYVGGGLGKVYCLGNLSPARLATDTVLRGAPSPSAVERSSASVGDEITSVGTRDSRSGQEWIEVTIAGVTGWIPLDAIDPVTLPPEGELEYVYVP